MQKQAYASKIGVKHLHMDADLNQQFGSYYVREFKTIEGLKLTFKSKYIENLFKIYLHICDFYDAISDFETKIMFS